MPNPNDDLRPLYCEKLGLCRSLEVDLDWAIDNTDATKLHAMCEYYLAERKSDAADYFLPLCILLSFELLLETDGWSREDELAVVQVMILAFSYEIDNYYLYKVIDTSPAPDDKLGQWFMARFPDWEMPPSPWK